MKVKIGNTIYTSEDGPIMVILNKQDKINIANMLETATKYCEFDEDSTSLEEVEEFMET